MIQSLTRQNVIRRYCPYNKLSIKLKPEMSESKIVEYQKLFWDITGLSENKVKEYPTEDRIESKIFTIVVDGKVTELYFQLYLNGQKAEHKGYLSLFLHLKEKMLSDFDITYNFGISCQKKDYVGVEIKRTKKQWEDGFSWGQPKWIDHSTLFNPENEFFTAGKLTIFCDVKISMPQESTAAVIHSAKLDKAIDVFSKMFIKEELKDCELHTNEGGILKCHKSILAARSPVFEAMFTIDMEEASKGVVKIMDFDSVTMNQLLRFAYCLEVEELDDIAGDLILAADKYQIEELKEICCNSLTANLKQDNVFNSLSIAEKIVDSENLFDYCLKVIAMNYKVLSKTAKWKELQQPTLLKIIEFAMLHFKPSGNFYHSANI